MRTLRLGTATLLAVNAAAASGAQQSPSLTAPSPATSAAHGAATATIVLVHGAFADATGWQAVIPLLQADGYKVVAVENALASLAGDVETTKRVIDARAGPTQQDRAISPGLERFYAKRMKAHTTEIRSSHVVFISQPKEVAGVISEEAAAAHERR